MLVDDKYIKGIKMALTIRISTTAIVVRNSRTRINICFVPVM